MEVEHILEIQDLKVEIEGNRILDGINFSLKSHESYVIFGPNGSGKTSLLNALMGISQYRIVGGKIIYKGQEINSLGIDERARLGITMGFQHPPEIHGVKLSTLLKICLGKDRHDDFSVEELEFIKKFKMEEFLDRDINVGFSGGERKRAEILQMIFMKPQLILLDEPDSGVDIDSLKLISIEIQQYLEKTGASALIITHKGDVLDHIKTKYACIIMNGKNHCFANPKQIYEEIRDNGYEHCISCNIRLEEGWKP